VLFYTLGGIAFFFKLLRKNLPTTEVVGRLPREFLLSEAFRVLAWGLLVGIVVGFIFFVRALWKRNWRVPQITAANAKEWFSQHWLALTLGAVACLAAGVAIEVLVRPLPQGIACQKNGGKPVYGWYIGQSGDRTYIGVIPPRIASLPNDKLGFVFIGGGGSNDRGVQICKEFESP
jgi:hypothetical protein